MSGYFKDYYAIMLLELPLMVINASFGMFIRGEGKPQYFMRINILNVLLNILLNYLFVRWLGWGVKGIALASLIAAVVALIFILYFFARKSEVYKLRRFTYSGEVMRDTLLNGGSEFIGEMSLCISMFAYNYVILKNIGVDGVTAFTIVGYVAYVFSMVVIGFGQGAVPLFSFTYGAKEHALATELRRLTGRMVMIAGAVVFGLVLLGSRWYGGLCRRGACSFRHDYIRRLLPALGRECDYLVLLYLHRQGDGVGRDFVSTGAGSSAGMYLYFAADARHDGCVAGRACHGRADLVAEPGFHKRG